MFHNFSKQSSKLDTNCSIIWASEEYSILLHQHHWVFIDNCKPTRTGLLLTHCHSPNLLCGHCILLFKKFMRYYSQHSFEIQWQKTWTQDGWICKVPIFQAWGLEFDPRTQVKGGCGDISLTFLQWEDRDKRIFESYWAALPNQWETMFQRWVMLKEYLQLKNNNWGGPVSYRQVHTSTHTCLQTLHSSEQCSECFCLQAQVDTCFWKEFLWQPQKQTNKKHICFRVSCSCTNRQEPLVSTHFLSACVSRWR